MVGQQLVQAGLDIEDFLGVDLDIGGLTLEAAQRLVDHHARVRQAVTLALGTSSQQEGAHAAGLADADGRDVRLDELHGVVDRHAGGDGTARRVDVQMDILVRVFRFKEQQLRNDEVGHVVLYRANQEDHTLLQQARVDVVSAFATGGLLDNHRDQAACGLDVRALLNIRIAGHVLRSLPNSHGLNTHKPARRLACGGFLREKPVTQRRLEPVLV